MISITPSPTFWKTVRLLLGVSSKRADGRRRRQQELLNSRSKKQATDWSGFGFFFAVLFMIALNVCAAFVVQQSFEAGERINAKRQGRVVVSESFRDAMKTFIDQSRQIAQQQGLQNPDSHFDSDLFAEEAKRIAERDGGSQNEIEQRLRDEVYAHGADNLVADDEATPGISALSQKGRLPAMLASLALFVWFLMLVFQGEGLELDLQRRRNPMWEWLFSHPVQPGAIFLAEMLSPIAANPIYWSAPLFAGFLYGMAYGPLLGLAATFLVGVPIAFAAACVGKAFEVAVILRFAPRSRGAIVGVMSWLGYASMMAMFLGLFIIPKLVTALAKPLTVLAALLPWPWLGLFLGRTPGGSLSFPLGALTCLIASTFATVAAVWFSGWGAGKGLAGNFGAADAGPSAGRKGPANFGKEPLYRKEAIWFMRDRSAIVQTILIPVTVAGVQMFNLRYFVGRAQEQWNYLSGAAILFGTYFLWILGPKSLASEGQALWISLTWPRGLESLLKAKAWLWSLISTGIVSLILCYAIVLFPAEAWKIVLVGVAWFVFARSMSEKSVTLVVVTSESGEPEKIPWGRRAAAQLGMLTFAIGICSQQWHIALMGIVYSYITAAAMWQNFRARLPFLYDPWSETLPPPPTLMHAMISISILVEGGAVLSTLMIAIAGHEYLAPAMTIGYALCAFLITIGVMNFLENRGVGARDVWAWEPKEINTQPWWRGYGARDGRLLLSLLAGAAGGVMLGIFANGYLAVLHHIPFTAEILRHSAEQMAQVPDLRLWYGIAAVFFAPFAEEYLFRGLLFRALDREWGGWAAVFGSAAFFAIYHSPIAWLPVGMVGVANALLFKKTRRLAPAVVLHMVYNTVVVLSNN